LHAALLALAARSPVRVEVRGEDPGRLPAAVEAAAYFCASEAATNAIKHSGADSIRIDLSRSADWLHVAVTDPGRGGARTDGHGLRGLADRLAAIDGRLAVSSPPGGGTCVLADLPVRPASATAPRSEPGAA
jgi:signal transduction histidine kinase